MIDPTQEQVEAVKVAIWEACSGAFSENSLSPEGMDALTREATAAIAALRPWMRGGWKSMDSAPRDRSYVLVKLRDDALQGGNFSHYAGRCFVAYHEGLTASGYDMGWGLFPGFGGVCDNQIAAWMPLPLYRGASHD